MLRQRWTWTAVFVVVLAPGAGFAQAQRPGVTDLRRADPNTVRVEDFVQALSSSPRGTRLSPTERPTLLVPIRFEFGSADLTPESREWLEKLSSALGSPDLGHSRFLIEGHTDSVGSDEFNRSLSARRAESVKAFVAARGIPPERLRAEGRGESEPAAANADEAGRAENRRVEIVNLGVP
jgi:OOP family OmpA-OmpF porin